MKQIVENLSHLYDPFISVFCRSTRFRTAFSSELTNYFRERKYRVKDRDWFDPVICHFLNDVVTVNRYGFKEVYDLYLTQQFANSKNVLGKELDLLNWHEGEKRQGERVNRDRKIWLNYKNTQGVRFVLLDAYLRYGDKFVDALREELTSSKKKGGWKGHSGKCYRRVEWRACGQVYPGCYQSAASRVGAVSAEDEFLNR